MNQRPVLLLAAAAFALAPLHLAAQQPNTEFKIAGITPSFVTTPEFSISYGPKNKRVAKNKNFLEVEVNFDWQPRAKTPEFLDEITLNYFILLKNESRENPKGTLLTGSVTHVAIPQQKGLNSVMYVSPRTLERFFSGKIPSTVDGAVVDVGVTITAQGQLVAEGSWKGRGQWWTGFQQVGGYVLNKNETPFAPLVWDYYEAIKSRPGGM
jgi:hypothetical protein